MTDTTEAPEGESTIEPSGADASIEEMIEPSRKRRLDTEAEAQALAATAEPEPAPVEAAPEPKEPGWYRKALKEKDRKLREVERQLELRAERELAPRHQAEQGQDFPDPIEDPRGFYDAVQSAISYREMNNKLNTSEMLARDRHGDDLVDDFIAWAGANPDVAQWMAGQPNPYAAGIAQFKRVQLADEIGDDPEVWRQSERDRIRAEVEAEMRGQSGQPAATPRTPLPGPASQARSAGKQSAWAGPTPLRKFNFD